MKWRGRQDCCACSSECHPPAKHSLLPLAAGTSCNSISPCWAPNLPIKHTHKSSQDQVEAGYVKVQSAGSKAVLPRVCPISWACDFDVANECRVGGAQQQDAEY